MQSLKNKKLEKMQFAFRYVQEAKNGKWSADFRSHIKRIPMYLYTNGLIPTIAFVMSKVRKNEQAYSYKYIGKIILKYFEQFELKGKEIAELEGLISELFLISENKVNYRRCTLELISMLEWLVKFSDGMLKNQDEGDGNAK